MGYHPLYRSLSRYGVVAHQVILLVVLVEAGVEFCVVLYVVLWVVLWSLTPGVLWVLWSGTYAPRVRAPRTGGRADALARVSALRVTVWCAPCRERSTAELHL